MRSIVTRNQFEIGDGGIRHKPTGYSFTPYPGTPFDGTVNRGQLGNKLPSGEDYRPQEVEEMTRRLWAAHVAQRAPE